MRRIRRRDPSGKGRSWADAGTSATGEKVAVAGDRNMRRTLLVCSLALMCVLQGSQAQADLHSMKAKWDCFWNRVRVDWHRNNAWPEPFNLVDQQAIDAPIAIMVDRGWQLQNTIPDELFDAETQELTRAGELKVQWILTQMPMRRRTVFVLRGNTPEITELRVKSVEKMAASVNGGTTTMVTVTDIIPRNGSASYFERVNTNFETSAPPPRLPAKDDGESK